MEGQLGDFPKDDPDPRVRTKYSCPSYRPRFRRVWAANDDDDASKSGAATWIEFTLIAVVLAAGAILGGFALWAIVD